MLRTQYTLWYNGLGNLIYLVQTRHIIFIIIIIVDAIIIIIIIFIWADQ